MKYKVTLNNRTYEVEVEQGEAILIDEYEALAPAPAAAPAAAPAVTAAAPAAAPQPAAGSGEPIVSPMPGSIIKINVTPGQKIKEGEVVLILEAMKMENEISATCSGTVARIAVSKGQMVETGAPLIYVAKEGA